MSGNARAIRPNVASGAAKNTLPTAICLHAKLAGHILLFLAVMTEPQPLFHPSQLRAWLLWQLRAAVVLLSVLGLSVVLSLILHAAGDDGAASALRGVVWLVVAGLGCDALALLITTALAVIRLLDDRKSNTDESPAESSRS